MKTLFICLLSAPLLAQDKPIDLAPIKPMKQQLVYVLRNQKGTACEVKIEPGPHYVCEGFSLDALTCRGEIVTYVPSCVEIKIVKEEKK